MIRLSLAILFFSLIVTPVWATTYYIGSNPSDNYRTFAEYRRAHPIDSAGDTISFRRGETFNETISVTGSGTSKNNVITFTSHGTGAKPIINPALILTGWKGPNEYGVYTAISTGHSPIFLYEDGLPLRLATDPKCTNGNWTKSGSTVYYKPTSGVPGNHTIRYIYYTSGGEAGVLPQALSVSNQSYVIIDGLRFDDAIGVNGKNISNITVKNCDFYYNPVRAIQFWGHGTIGPAVVDKNYFYRVFAGIYAGLHPDYTAGHTVETSGFTFTNNQLIDCGTVDGTTSWWLYGMSVTGFDIESLSGQNVQDSTWSGNSIIGGTCPGPMLYTLPGGTTSGNKIMRNFIYNIKNPAIKIQGDPTGAINNNIIAYNIMSKIGAVNETNQSYFEYIAVTRSTQMNYFCNNTLYIPPDRKHQYILYLYSATAGNYRYMTIKNNIIFGPGRVLWIRNGTGGGKTGDMTVSCDYNLYSTTNGNRWCIGETANITRYDYAHWKEAGHDTHPAVNGLDPLFSNGTGSYSLASDFRLREFSPAINAGESVGLLKDYAGVPISGKPSIGAYEFQPSMQNPKNLRIAQ